MRSLLPRFIHDRFRSNQFEGEFTALTMFIDISGFTKMTETLMKGGDDGAEILSSILNRIFNPILNVIYRRNGFVSTFAGDAFTAIFPIESTSDSGEQARQVLYCAHRIQELFQRQGFQQTKFGDFQLHVKIGLAVGCVEWGIVGRTDRAYFFRGPAIDACAHAEHHAASGDTIFTSDFCQRLPDRAADSVEIDERFYRLIRMRHLPQARLAPSPRKRGRLTKSVLRHFLPEAVLNFNQMGEFRNVVSVFISFEGISGKTELDYFVSIVLDQIKHFSGYFNKIDFGDKGGVILCAFGAPVAFEDNIQRAVEFAHALKTEADMVERLRIRAGITYGMVYAGIIGGNKRCEYTIIGDIVNLSARFMMKAEFGEFWLSERIHRNAHESFNFTALGEFQFKGKSDAIPAFRLEGRVSSTRQKYSGKYVGRQNERKQIDQFLKALHDERFAGVCYVYGNAGVGKSRFSYELRQDHTDKKWLYLPCDGVLRKSFNPFLHFLTNFFQLTHDADREANRLQFQKSYNRLIAQAANSPEIQVELKRLQSIVEGFLDIHDETADSLYNQLEPKLRYENTLYAFKEIVKALSLVQPVVVEIEDLQWIDADSRLAIQTLCRDIDSFAIAVVALSRYYEDDTKPDLDLAPAPQVIELKPFTDDDLAELAEFLIGGHLSPQLHQNLKQKTNGNPFFIEQTIFYYRDADLLTFDDSTESWDLTGESTTIPDSVNDLLIARIDRLTTRLKEAIQVAAVIGFEFELPLLAKVIREFSSSWQARDQEAFIQEGPKNNVWVIISEMKAIFSNAMMHDAVYRMQLKSRLRQIHQLIAETMESLYAQDKQVYADLAYHYEKAEDTPKMLEYLLKAAEFALDNYQNSTAFDFVEKWIKVVKADLSITEQNIDFQKIDNTDPALIDKFIQTVLYLKSYLLQLIDDTDQALSDLNLVMQIANHLNNSTHIAGTLVEIGIILLSKSQFEEAIEKFMQVLLIIENVDSPRAISSVYQNLGRAYMMMGNLSKALNFFEKDLEYCRKINNDKMLARSLGSIGVVYDYMGNSSEALGFYQEQEKIYEKINEKAGIALVCGNIGIVHTIRGEFESAMKYFQQKLELSQLIGNKREIANVLGNIGEIKLEQNKFNEALRYQHQKLLICREIGDNVENAIALLNIGRIYSKQNILDIAIRFIDEGLDIINALRINFLLPAGYIEKATVLFYQNELEKAKEFNNIGLELARKMNDAEYVKRGEELLVKLE